MDKSTNCFFQFDKSLDAVFLNDLFADDLSYVIVVFKDFLQELPRWYHDLKAAYESGDIKRTKSVAHKGKTLFAYAGLTKISAILNELEVQCTSSEKLPAVSLFNEVLDQRTAVQNLITGEIKRLEAFYEK